jgi:enamine deaminase RidA (YjgF/YER057c/UK114 family)
MSSAQATCSSCPASRRRSNKESAAQTREQLEQAFAHLDLYLAAAAATMGDIAELTSYHVDPRRHLDAFMAVDRHIRSPYPAWSAIGVSELITPGALVELRVVTVGWISPRFVPAPRPRAAPGGSTRAPPG